MKNHIEKVIDEVLNEYLGPAITSDKRFVPVGVSNRHLHLSPEHLEMLFGRGYQLTPYRNLIQPGQYATKETLTLVAGGGGVLENVRIIGPPRSNTQIELLLSDSIKLKIEAPVRISGDIKRTPGITIVGKKGSVTIDEGVIIAARHLHLSLEEAADFGLKDGQTISARSIGPRAVVFENVVVRSGKAHRMEFHIDVDEASACCVSSGDMIEIIY